MNSTERNNSSKRGCSPTATQSKRKKQLDHDAHLPAEIWSSVMGYLDFSSVLSMTATSRTMNDAAPLVSELHITKSCQLHGSVGRRFKEVECINIYSLTQIRDLDADRDEDEMDAVIDFETSVRAVPFMYTFTNLKRIYFGGINIASELYGVVPFDVMIDPELNEQHFSRLIDSISAGFRCGILPSSLEVNGLLCTRIWQTGDNDDPCGVCSRACQSFPIKTVTAFECGEGHNDLQSQNCICLKVNEWIRLLDSRPECQEGFLSSKAPILELLGQCERIHMATKRGKSLYLLDYSFRTEVKLDIILDESRIDVSQLNCWEVSDAILKSFPTTEKDVYMLSDWAEKILDTSNIRVDENVFGSRSRQIEIARDFFFK